MCFIYLFVFCFFFKDSVGFPSGAFPTDISSAFRILIWNKIKEKQVILISFLFFLIFFIVAYASEWDVWQAEISYIMLGHFPSLITLFVNVICFIIFAIFLCARRFGAGWFATEPMWKRIAYFVWIFVCISIFIGLIYAIVKYHSKSKQNN